MTGKYRHTFKRGLWEIVLEVYWPTVSWKPSQRSWSGVEPAIGLDTAFRAYINQRSEWYDPPRKAQRFGGGGLILGLGASFLCTKIEVLPESRR